MTDKLYEVCIKPNGPKEELCQKLALIVAQKWAPFHPLGDEEYLKMLSCQTVEIYRRAFDVLNKEIKLSEKT